MSLERKGHHGPSTFDGKSQIDSTSRPAWYAERVEAIPDAGRQLLEVYSGIPAERVLPHVLAIRDKAFDIWSYACIGQVRFLDFTLPKLPYWRRILPRLRAGASFVDAGCCFGQEIRFLVFKEGIAATQLYGFDLEPAFLDLGYELFLDRDKLHVQMLSGDVLADSMAPDGKGLEAVEGKMDIVHAASLLHSWGWDDMVTATKRLVSLTRKLPGSMIIGNQMGSLDAGQYPMPTGTGLNYRHNVESMERFWAQVGKETGSSWKVESDMFLPPVVKENMAHSWARSDPNLRMIWFCAKCIS